MQITASHNEREVTLNAITALAAIWRVDQAEIAALCGMTPQQVGRMFRPDWTAPTLGKCRARHDARVALAQRAHRVFAAAAAGGWDLPTLDAGSAADDALARIAERIAAAAVVLGEGIGR